MTEISENPTKTTSLKTQGAWLLFAKITGFTLTTLLPFLVVRILSKEEVGIYQLVFLAIINAVAILPFGISMSSYYFLAREKERHGSVILNILIFNFFMGGVACIGLNLYPQLLGDIFKNDEITRLAPKIGIVIWLWLFSSFIETVAVANQEMRIATFFIVFSQFTKTLLMVCAVIFFSTVEAFIYAAMIQGVVQSIVLFYYLSSRFPKFWKKFDAGFFREHLIYALPFGMSSLLWTLQMDIHRYFVGNRFSEEEYAIYAIGCFQLPFLTLLVESVNAVMIPRMSKLQETNEQREMVLLSARAMQKLALFLFPATAFLFLTAGVFIVTLYTRNYEASVPIFLLNLLVWPFYIIVSDAIARAYEDLGRLMVILRIVFFVILIGLLYYGIHNFNLLGMMGIVVVTAIFDRLLQGYFAFRRIGTGKGDIVLLKNTGIIALVSGGAVFLTYFVFSFVKAYTPMIGNSISHLFFSAPKVSVVDFISGSLTLGISGLFFAVVYLFGINYFGAIEAEEKESLIRIVEKAKALLAGKSEKGREIPLAEESKV